VIRSTVRVRARALSIYRDANLSAAAPDSPGAAHPLRRPAPGGQGGHRAKMPTARAISIGTVALAYSPLGVFALCAGLPLAVGTYVLLSSPVVLSREMTWDFLFNLAGAWHVFNGHIAHVEFHDPVGSLNFYLTALGFHLVGPGPQAFVVGAAVLAAVICAAATFVAWRRLPLLPAALFVLFSGFQILMPASPGDQPNAYSFAMSYNRYGWSAFGVLALLLFVPPRNGRRGDAVDVGIATILLLALFYLKITYFGAALLMVVCALLLSRHLRARSTAWVLVTLAVTINALALHSWSYIRDVLGAASRGAIRDNLVMHANFILNHGAEYAAGLALFGIAYWLWRHASAPARLPFSVALVLVSGFLLLTQNSQSHAMPMGIVAAFIVYDELHQKMKDRRWVLATPLLIALLPFPVLALAGAGASVVGYTLAATRSADLEIVTSTHLRGLAVPKASGPALLAAVANEAEPRWSLLNKARESRARHELLPAEYIETLLEAADLLSPFAPQTAIVLLDQVNPLPFMLGLAPPKGGDLWSDGPGSPAEQLLLDVEFVLVPKFPTSRQITDALVAAYAPYVSLHFNQVEESRSWFLFRRAPIGTPRLLLQTAFGGHAPPSSTPSAE
jgi:hypothetical protein